MDISESKRASRASLNGRDAGGVACVDELHRKNRRARKKESTKLHSSDVRRSGKPIDIKQAGLSKQSGHRERSTPKVGNCRAEGQATIYCGTRSMKMR